MKQTAIQLLKESVDYEMKLGTKMVVNWDMYIEMEKEQIIDAYDSGQVLGFYLGAINENETDQTGEIFYQEKYK
jgi:hypothetical protein